MPNYETFGIKDEEERSECSGGGNCAVCELGGYRSGYVRLKMEGEIYLNLYRTAPVTQHNTMIEQFKVWLVLYGPSGVRLNSCTFCPHSEFMGFVWI